MKNLVFSKWTREGAEFLKKHFLVRLQDEKSGLLVLQSVMDKSTVKISTMDLNQSAGWKPGWHR